MKAPIVFRGHDEKALVVFRGHGCYWAFGVHVHTGCRETAQPW